MAKQVIFYAQPGWRFSEQEREYLSQNGVDFIAKDVTAEPALWEELAKLEVYAVPALMVGESAVVGFDRAQIDALLGLAAAGVDHGRPVESK